MTEREEEDVVIVDCEGGRRMGCATYCCRLIVRLAPGERDPSQPENAAKRCVDKDPATGWCVCLDPTTMRCRVWEARPRVCREFDCNADPLLSVVLRHGFISLTHLVTAPKPERRSRRRVPLIRPRPPSPRDDDDG